MCLCSTTNWVSRHVISGKGVTTDPSKIATIQTWPAPINVTEIRGFLGLAGYYCKFIRHYGQLCRPLTNLLKKGSIFRWTRTGDKAFLALKHALVNAPVLALPDFSKMFVVKTDACGIDIGAVLMQEGHPPGICQ